MSVHSAPVGEGVPRCSKEERHGQNAGADEERSGHQGQKQSECMYGIGEHTHTVTVVGRYTHTYARMHTHLHTIVYHCQLNTGCYACFS